jgi:hypothetical protein
MMNEARQIRPFDERPPKRMRVDAIVAASSAATAAAPDASPSPAPPLPPSASPSVDEVSHLNQTGINNMLSGRDDEAERCFSRALGRLDGKFVVHSSARRGDGSRRPASPTAEAAAGTAAAEPLLLRGASGRCLGGANDSIEHDHRDVAEPPAKAEDVRLLYLYQRQEYDEG